MTKTSGNWFLYDHLAQLAHNKKSDDSCQGVAQDNGGACQYGGRAYPQE